MIYLQLLSLVAALAILFRCIYIAAHIGLKEFNGHLVRFLFLSGGYALAGTSAMATVFGAPHMKYLFVISIAIIFFADRRLGFKRVLPGKRRMTQ